MSHSSIRLSLALAASCCAASSASSQQHHLYTFEGEVADAFGRAVGLTPDVENDGFADVIVGAADDSTAAPGAGAVRVLAGYDGLELYAAFGATAGDALGSSVAVANDYTGDRIPELLVGAPQPTAGGGPCGGRGYVRVVSGADGLSVHTFVGLEPCARFGAAVVSAGDWTGDGYDEFLVGAPFTSAGGTVYVYDPAAPQAPFLTFESPYADAGAGLALAGFEDFDGDLEPDFLVGAPRAGVSGPKSGAAFLVSGADGGVLRQWNGTGAGDFFGAALAAVGDVDGDGRTDVAIGAPQGNGVEEASVVGNGYVRVISGDDGSVLTEIPGAAFGELFGFAVAAAGDVDGDARADVAVGAPWADDGGKRAGRVEIDSIGPDELLTTWAGDVPGGQLGRSLFGALDVNRDALPDVVAGAVGAGRAQVLSGPHLTMQTDAHTISAAVGGVMTADIDVGPEMAGLAYYVLGSNSGTEPGIFLVNMLVPLNWDWYFCETAVYPNAGPFSANLGSLDRDGRATMKLTIGPGALLPVLIGAHLDHCLMVFNPGGFPAPIEHVSAVAPMSLLE